MSLLIADIGTCHFGNMKLAKELVRVANESGADIIKGHAFASIDVKWPSMKPAFYDACTLSEDQCMELVQYARMLKTDMFFSIFSSGFERLKELQKWTKFAPSQTKSGLFGPAFDSHSTIVSVPKQMINARRTPRMRKAWPMYSTEYFMKDSELQNIDFLKDQTQGEAGLSDHSVGVESCLKAVRWYGANCIEKHFTLQKEVTWGGEVMPDTIHGATPKELEVIAIAMH